MIYTLDSIIDELEARGHSGRAQVLRNWKQSNDQLRENNKTLLSQLLEARTQMRTLEQNCQILLDDDAAKTKALAAAQANSVSQAMADSVAAAANAISPDTTGATAPTGSNAAGASSNAPGTPAT